MDQPSEANPPSASPTVLPWSGGTFTWPSGVSVTTSVELVEPVAEKRINFCDGCLNLVRKDLKFALRYTIAVPADFGGPLAVSDCAGTLSIDNGNDDESFVSYAGDESRPLNGVINAGKTKYGVTEWGIKKSAAGSTFTYTNACGDVEGAGVFGTWGGRLPDLSTPQPRSMFAAKKGTYFEVKVVLIRQYKDGLAVLAQACLLRRVPGIGDYVPSTLSPWSVQVGERRVKPSVRDERTTYDADATLTPGEDWGACNNGWIFFPTKGEKVTSVNYSNSLGEKASWSMKV